MKCTLAAKRANRFDGMRWNVGWLDRCLDGTGFAGCGSIGSRRRTRVLRYDQPDHSICL